MTALTILTFISVLITLLLNFLLVVRTTKMIDVLEDLLDEERKTEDGLTRHEFTQHDLNVRLEKLQRSKFGYMGRTPQRNETDEEK